MKNSSEEKRPELIDVAYIGGYLAKAFGFSRAGAGSKARDLLTEIAVRLPQVAFICLYCDKARGECRCRSHGYESRGRWYYIKTKTKPWLCVVESLVALKSSELQSFGPVRGERLEMLIRHLRKLPE